MNINQRTSSVKHIPQRTCVVCRRIRPKRELVRLVCVSDGSVEVDISGKKEGRGAYLCPVRECWEAGLNGGRLEHNLQTTLTQNNREELMGCGEDLVNREVEKA